MEYLKHKGVSLISSRTTSQLVGAVDLIQQQDSGAPGVPTRRWLFSMFASVNLILSRKVKKNKNGSNSILHIKFLRGLKKLVFKVIIKVIESFLEYEMQMI